jgi:hypothetical protein
MKFGKLGDMLPALLGDVAGDLLAEGVAEVQESSH